LGSHFCASSHADLPGYRFEAVAPGVIRFDAGDAKALDDPLAEALRNLLPLRIGVFPAFCPFRIVEEWQPRLRALRDVVEEFLFYEMRVDWDDAFVVALGHFGTKIEALDPRLFVRAHVRGQQRSDFVHARAGIGADPRYPASGCARFRRGQVRKGGERRREDLLGLNVGETLLVRILGRLDAPDPDAGERILGRKLAAFDLKARDEALSDCRYEMIAGGARFQVSEGFTMRVDTGPPPVERFRSGNLRSIWPFSGQPIRLLGGFNGTSFRQNAQADLAEPSVPGVSWAAVLAGAVASLALTLVLLSFGAGMGFSVVSSWGNSGVSATTFKIGTGLYFIVMAMISSAIGGYLAGRLRTKWVGVQTAEVHFRDYRAWLSGLGGRLRSGCRVAGLSGKFAGGRNACRRHAGRG
jgi:hypothetical protein